MTTKEELLELLSSLSEEDIKGLLKKKKEQKDKVEEKNNTHTIRRRGSGYSKSKRRVANNEEGSTNTKGRRKKKRKRKNGRSSKGRACRTMPMEIHDNRPNLFEDMQMTGMTKEERQELAEAAKADKIARKNPNRVKLPKRKSPLVEVECSVCGEEYEVASSIVHDARRWKCNDCICG